MNPTCEVVLTWPIRQGKREVLLCAKVITFGIPPVGTEFVSVSDSWVVERIYIDFPEGGVTCGIEAYVIDESDPLERFDEAVAEYLAGGWELCND